MSDSVNFILGLLQKRTLFEQILFGLALFEIFNVFQYWFGAKKHKLNSSRDSFLPWVLAIVRMEAGLFGLNASKDLFRVHMMIQVVELLVFSREFYYRYINTIGYTSMKDRVRANFGPFVITSVVLVLTAYMGQIFNATY